MRAVHTRISFEDGWVGPFHRAVGQTDDLRLEALHQLRLLDEGSTIMLYEYTGERDTAERLARAHLSSDRIQWQTTRLDRVELMYAHDESPGDLLLEILWGFNNWPVVIDWPIQFIDDDEIGLTLIGDGQVIRDGLNSLPPDLDVSLERSGEYRSDSQEVIRTLTPKERETTRTAVELGHYRNPREASYQELADELNCSTGTVGHHLRNAESKIMQHLFE